MAGITLPFIDESLRFPNPAQALDEPDGLLCFGGDLSVERLKLAYKSGIFPWFSEGEPLLWWSPSTRCIIEPKQFHLSQSLKKHIRNQSLKVTVNQEFTAVIQACASIPRLGTNGEPQGTWITHSMLHAYEKLHKAGYAHSIEVWRDSELVGGLYGVVTSGVFCGESMFHKEKNASKVAMYALCKILLPFDDAFIDCQMPTSHLLSLGAFALPRDEFLSKLEAANQHNIGSSAWSGRII